MGEINYEPLGDRVIVRPKDAEEKTKSGIVLPGSAQEKPQIGDVISVGPGRVSDDGKTISMNLHTGDIVLYPQFGGTEITVDNQKYLVIIKNISKIKTKKNQRKLQHKSQTQ